MVLRTRALHGTMMSPPPPRPPRARLALPLSGMYLFHSFNVFAAEARSLPLRRQHRRSGSGVNLTAPPRPAPPRPIPAPAACRRAVLSLDPLKLGHVFVLGRKRESGRSVAGWAITPAWGAPPHGHS